MAGVSFDDAWNNQIIKNATDKSVPDAVSAKLAEATAAVQPETIRVPRGHAKRTRRPDAYAEQRKRREELSHSDDSDSDSDSDSGSDVDCMPQMEV